MMNAKSSVVAVMTMAALGLGGCAPLPKMDSFMPVQLDTQFGTPRYTQEGHAINASDMEEKLSQEPEAAPHVSRARALRVVSTILSLAGGAMIGVPVGQKLGGNDKPLWALAAAGGASVGLSIPFSIGAVASVDSAVTAHNRSINGPSTQGKRAAPAVAVGIALDRSLAAARAGDVGVGPRRWAPTSSLGEGSAALAEGKP